MSFDSKFNALLIDKKYPRSAYSNYELLLLLNNLITEYKQENPFEKTYIK